MCEFHGAHELIKLMINIYGMYACVWHEFASIVTGFIIHRIAIIWKETPSWRVFHHHHHRHHTLHLCWNQKSQFATDNEKFVSSIISGWQNMCFFFSQNNLKVCFKMLQFKNGTVSYISYRPKLFYTKISMKRLAMHLEN